MEGQGARLVHEVGSLCLETMHVLEMEEETERAKEADRGMGAGRRGGGGACGLDFSAPPPPPTPHSPVPQILSWGPQGRTAPSSCRGLCVCGREAGSHSPSSSSGPAGGGSSSPSCSFSSSCKTRRGSEPGHDRTVYSIILSLGCLTLGESGLTPGHTPGSHVPQQHGDQEGVTTLVRQDSGGQTVGERGRGRQGPA